MLQPQDQRGFSNPRPHSCFTPRLYCKRTKPQQQRGTAQLVLHIKTLLLKKSRAILKARLVLKACKKSNILSPIVPSAEVQLCRPFECGSMEYRARGPSGKPALLDPEVEQRVGCWRSAWGWKRQRSRDMDTDRQRLFLCLRQRVPFPQSLPNGPLPPPPPATPPIQSQRAAVRVWAREFQQPPSVEVTFMREREGGVQSEGDKWERGRRGGVCENELHSENFVCVRQRDRLALDEITARGRSCFVI